jgi:hypothetical protein
MRIFKATLIIIFLSTSLSSHAETGRGMVLFMEPTFAVGGFMGGVGCKGLYHISPNVDIPDLRDFRLYYCQGKYTLTVEAPSGTVATVFGAFDFKPNKGFLIIKKTDDKVVWILNLENFPDRRWHSVPPKGDYGGYEAFYSPASAFDENLGSAKWGEWWGDRSLESFGAGGK